NRLELSAGTEGRNRGRLHLDRLARARVARDAGGAATLFEHTESGDGHAVTLVHRTHDRVDDVLDRRGSLPTIRAHFLREYVDELCLVHAKTSEACGPFMDRLVDTVNPVKADFQEPRAISGGFSEQFGNPVAALGRWRDSVPRS